MNIRTINKVSALFDISSVVYPAYSSASSSVALRSMEQWQENEETKKLEESLEAEKIEAQKEDVSLDNLKDEEIASEEQKDSESTNS